jgi:hypothetical protein
MGIFRFIYFLAFFVEEFLEVLNYYAYRIIREPVSVSDIPSKLEQKKK